MQAERGCGKRAQRFRVQASGTTRTYFYCWAAARRALDHAEHQEAGALYFRMMACVFAAFTVEAFLNDVGQRKVRDWATIEPKSSPRQKLLLLREALHWSFDAGKRPFQTFRLMLRVRDALAHGKTVTVVQDVIVTKPPPDLEPWPEPEWKQLCSDNSTRRMVDDAEAIVRELNKQSGSTRDPFASPGHGSSGVQLIED